MNKYWLYSYQWQYSYNMTEMQPKCSMAVFSGSLAKLVLHCKKQRKENWVILSVIEIDSDTYNKLKDEL